MSQERILLIFPPSNWGIIERFCQPLGILTIATVLKQEGMDVTPLDLSAEGWFPQKLARYIKDHNFSHVGVTVLTPFRTVAYDILRIAKKINPNIITLVGGPHATYMKENILSECAEIDIAVSGEAELGLAAIIRSPSQRFYDLGHVKDIDSLPNPDRGFIRHIKYDRMSNIWIGDSASMSWIRGCQWGRCRFCSRDALTITHRRRNSEKIIEEIGIIQNELGYKNLIVVDDSLKVNSRYTKEILRIKIKEGLDIPFWSLARADHIDEEGARLLKRANATGLLIGLESIVPRIIDMYRKTSKPPTEWYKILDRTFELADKYELIVIATFILGGPSETAEEIRKTIDYCRGAKLDLAQPFPFQYAIGSDLWREAVDQKLILPTQYYTYNDNQFGTSDFTTERLFEMALEAEFLINSPLLNVNRYIRLIRKLIKQKKISIIAQNLGRLPFIIRDNWKQHSYEMVPEEFHG
ncbi:MAG: B12-binding domain-containing radical SAM protein [Candidatus Hodarchaeales archaeon]|jgi:anaerobic magnesium-protoporphyrin IX monomethyl ester cyclase